jgi:flagellar biosynthesis protein FliR
MYLQLMVLIFLALGGHHIFLSAYFYSFHSLPLDRGLAVEKMEPFFQYTMHLTGEILLIAVVLAAPVVAATFITDVVFGILNRVAPQLNAYFMSMPVKAMAGIIIILIAFEPIVTRLREFVVWSLGSIERTIELLTIVAR